MREISDPVVRGGCGSATQEAAVYKCGGFAATVSEAFAATVSRRLCSDLYFSEALHLEASWCFEAFEMVASEPSASLSTIMPMKRLQSENATTGKKYARDVVLLNSINLSPCCPLTDK